MNQSRLLAAAFACSLSFTAVPAFAESPADKAFHEGLQAMARKDYAVACEKFRQSDSLDPSRSARHELAKCELSQGKFRAAWHDVQSVIKASAANDKEILPAAKETAAAIEKRAPHLTIRLSPEAPDDTVVSINGADVPRGDLGKPIVVDAGETHLLARTPAGGEDKQTFSLAEGESREIKMAPWIEPAGKPEKAAEKSDKPAPHGAGEESGTTQKTVGYVVVGVGAAALLGAGFFGYKYATDPHDACVTTGRASVYQSCKDDQSTWKTHGTVTAVLGGLGVVGVGVGLYLVSTATSADATASSRGGTTLVPWVGWSHAGAALSTTWLRQGERHTRLLWDQRCANIGGGHRESRRDLGNGCRGRRRRWVFRTCRRERAARRHGRSRRSRCRRSKRRRGRLGRNRRNGRLGRHGNRRRGDGGGRGRRSRTGPRARRGGRWAGWDGRWWRRDRGHRHGWVRPWRIGSRRVRRNSRHRGRNRRHRRKWGLGG